MASVFWGSGKPADEVADFDEYDPTPYGGGYDLVLTFGRALPPSDETCYPISTTTSSSSSSGGGHHQYGRRPGSQDAYDAAAQHRRRPPSEETHDSAGYGRKGRVDEDDGDGLHGATGGSRKPKPAYGDERPKYHGAGAGDDLDERPTYGRGRKKHDDDDDGSGDERKPRYKKHDDDDDSGDERKPRYKKHDDGDDSDDERKRRYEKNNRRRHDYDD
ncbi:hypothetical protein ABZP36_031844 [Zizania latifolia]